MKHLRFLVALTLAGCSAQCEVSTDNTLKLDQVRTLISTDMTKKLGAAPASITCPDKVVAEKGKSFECRFKTGDGADVVATVEQKDDEGNVRVTYAPDLASPEVVSGQIQKSLAEKLGPELKVDCGPLWRLQGVPFACKATLGPRSGTVKVTWSGTELEFGVELSGADEAAPPLAGEPDPPPAAPAAGEPSADDE